MDKVSDYGSEESRFESWRGRPLLSEEFDGETVLVKVTREFKFDLSSCFFIYVFPFLIQHYLYRSLIAGEQFKIKYDTLLRRYVHYITIH